MPTECYQGSANAADPDGKGRDTKHLGKGFSSALVNINTPPHFTVVRLLSSPKFMFDDMTTHPSPPYISRIHHASVIRADPALAASLTAFINEGYRYMSPANRERWEPDLSDRLPSDDSIHQALGDDGLLAVVYEPNTQTPIACAATKRWESDLEGYAEEGESGWEIKMVTTHIEWMKRGLAGQCVDKLIDELARQEQSRPKDGTGMVHEPLYIWIQAVECLNGPFWLKKGGALVRSYDKPTGHWGSKCGYRLLVLLREIDVEDRLLRVHHHMMHESGRRD